jgi:hypothetical protein
MGLDFPARQRFHGLRMAVLKALDLFDNFFQEFANRVKNLADSTNLQIFLQSLQSISRKRA